MLLGVGDKSHFRRVLWTETVTVFHRTLSDGANGKAETRWERFVVPRCFFGWKQRQLTDATTVIPADVHVVRIPAENVPNGFAIRTGDVVVRGNVDDVLAVNDSSVILTRKYGDEAFIAARVTDNTKFERTAHYFASE